MGDAKCRSIRRQKFVTNVIYGKHWHTENSTKLCKGRKDKICPLCGSKEDGKRHIIRGCTHKEMVACRRNWDIHINKKIMRWQGMTRWHGCTRATTR